MWDDGQLSTRIESEVTVAGLVSPRVGSEQTSLLMQTLHNHSSKQDTGCLHPIKAPASSRRALPAAYLQRCCARPSRILHEVCSVPGETHSNYPASFNSRQCISKGPYKPCCGIYNYHKAITLGLPALHCRVHTRPLPDGCCRMVPCISPATCRRTSSLHHTRTAAM